MERRNSFRKKVSFGAKLLSGKDNCNVFINNISKKGVFVRTAPVVSTKNFFHGKIFQLKLRTAVGAPIDLQCKVKWSCKTPPLGLTDNIGMEIIDPPAEYDSFFRSL